MRNTFDEIYTNYDISVNEEYLAQSCYPFDYSTRWLNVQFQSKRITIRRLDVMPLTHSFTLTVIAFSNDGDNNTLQQTANIDVTYADSLVKVRCSSLTQKSIPYVTSFGEDDFKGCS